MSEALDGSAGVQSPLYMIASAMADALNPEDLLHAVLDAVPAALGADAGWLLLPGSLPSSLFHFVATQQVPEDLLDGERTQPARNCPVYQRLALVQGGDINSSPILNCPVRVAARPEGEPLGSVACVPLYTALHLVGVLKIGWRRPGVLSECDRDLLLTSGRLVSATLHSAELIEMERATAVDRLTARLAHEINNPLQVVNSALALAREELDGEERDRVEQYLASAAEEVNRVADIVWRMCDCYNPQQGG